MLINIAITSHNYGFDNEIISMLSHFQGKLYIFNCSHILHIEFLEHIYLQNRNLTSDK